MKPSKYSLGLDIGTTSVGWAVIDLEKERIHDLGVRIFERPEDPQNGDSLAKPRRDARSARHRLKRRRQRLNYLKRFFVNEKILTQAQIAEILDPKSTYNKLDVYALRDKALNHKLTAEELFKVLYQISKRRGFKSNRKSVEETDREGGRVSKALTINEQLLAERGYKTVGQALAQDEKYTEHKRNKRDSYTNSFARADFIHELEEIIKSQRKYALNNVSDEALHSLIYGVDSDGLLTNSSAIMYQRPFMTEELIKKMVGECTFEKGEKRAPRASYSFEIFQFANNLVNLVFVPKNTNSRQAKREHFRLTLSPEQIAAVVAEAKKTASITYKKVRQVAGISEEYAPEYVRGKINKDDPYGEKNEFGKLKAYHDIKKALKSTPGDWMKVDNESMLNKIAYILTTEHEDVEILNKLSELPLSDEAKCAILKINPKNFRSFGHLSIKALQKITPHILSGLTYDKACKKVGYDYRKKAANLEQITNPVVKRAIAQTNKVVRAVIRKYGNPYFIRVETARDLAKNFKDRKAIENENKDNQAFNSEVKEIIEHGYNVKPKTKRGKNLLEFLRENNVPLSQNIDANGQMITKVKLYREQNGKCLYSGDPIDFQTMIHDDNAYQVDHIVPFSRSNNDGLTNKVLVKTEENQEKANRTPFEYFGGDETRWKQFVARVNAIYQTRDVKTSDKAINSENYKFNGYAMRKKQNLLIEEYKNDSWNTRALNDTRYITRFVQNYLRQTVSFAEGDDKQRVLAPNGTITSYLRKRWGLSKVREEDVLHHAADAAIVAAIDNRIICQANLFSRDQELKLYTQTIKSIEEKKRILLKSTDQETGEITEEDQFSQAQREKAELEYIKQSMDENSKHRFPEPWVNFAKEIRKRTLDTDTETLRNELCGLEGYDDEFRSQVQPIFVSRRQNHKIKGSLHDERIRSSRNRERKNVIRISLQELTLEKLDRSIAKEEYDTQKKHSGDSLYERLLNRLNEYATYDNKGKRTDHPDKAFAEPFYKSNKSEDKNGKIIAPVRSLKIYDKQTIIRLDRGTAMAEMTRLRIYKKNKQIYIIPDYAINILKGRESMSLLTPLKGVSCIDSSYAFVGFLYKKDCMLFRKGNHMYAGYFVQFESDNRITIKRHLAPDSNRSNKEMVMRTKISGISDLKICHVDILGDKRPETGIVWPGA